MKFCSPINRLEIDAKNILEEPKAIIFLSKLLLLFQFCHLCFAPKPNFKLSQSGTFISVTAKCEKCCQTFSSESQAKLLAKVPAGNLLLSFAALCAGAPIKKILVVFKHTNLLVHLATVYVWNIPYTCQTRRVNCRYETDHSNLYRRKIIAITVLIW